MFKTHDFHRFDGCSNPLGLYINPIELRLYGISSIYETEEENLSKKMLKNFLY